MLQPFVDALDPQRTIIRFDMPGLGRSPAPLFPYHLATTAPLLSGILDQLGYQQADVLGISWGGGPAQQFARRCPARVRRQVLVATTPGALMVPGYPRILLRMLTPRRHLDPGYTARIAGELSGGSTREDPWPARDLLHPVTRPGPARLLPPADIPGRLDQPPAAAAAAAARLDPGGRRRPDHPAGQRPDHAPADAAQRASHLSRRPPRPGPGSRTNGCGRGGVPRRGRAASAIALRVPRRSPIPYCCDMGRNERVTARRFPGSARAAGVLWTLSLFCRAWQGIGSACAHPPGPPPVGRERRRCGTHPVAAR
jgi:pimeloyl-ACP methyl ester carboxylesterase